jgi:hypothetical protein
MKEKRDLLLQKDHHEVEECPFRSISSQQKRHFVRKLQLIHCFYSVTPFHEVEALQPHSVRLNISDYEGNNNKNFKFITYFSLEDYVFRSLRFMAESKEDIKPVERGASSLSLKNLKRSLT